MKSVGVKDLKAHLSKYPRLVKSGETVRVTEHNRVIAETILEPTLQVLSTDAASLEWHTILEDLGRDRF
jgi:hypothetical protein